MRPLRIEFQAFGPYLGRELVDFEKIASRGLFLICGKTGVGKTMILDAMTYALYGKSSGNGRGGFESMRCTNAKPEDVTLVRFEFENYGEIYRFERKIEKKRKNFSTSCNAMRREEGEDGETVWIPLFENPKERDVEKKAVELIGLEYDQFRQVMVLPQGQFEKLLTSDSKEKEKILTSIFGEEKWQGIAEYFYEEAAERNGKLFQKKEGIRQRLSEEGCDTMEELRELLKNKKEELELLEEAYRMADYEKQMKMEQGTLGIARRFSDLHKAMDTVCDLEKKQEERLSWEQQLKDAKRAEKVRVFIEQTEQCEAEFTLRKEEEERAGNEACQAEKKAGQASLAREELIRAEEEIEKKKKLVIQYEGKRTQYEDFDRLRKEYDRKKKEEKKAQKEADTAEEVHKGCIGQIKERTEVYESCRQEHGAVLEAYLAGITGELAGQLMEGKPCPVCGSISHPHKAENVGQKITRQEVDQKKKEADAAYGKLQDAFEEEKQAKASYEQRMRVVQDAREETLKAQTDLENGRKNQVEGIETLKKLEDAIAGLSDAIKEYDRKKKKLETAEKKARELAAEKKAGMEAAAKEAKNAAKKKEQAEIVLKKELKEQQFVSLEEAEKLLLSEKEREKLEQKISGYDAEKKSAKAALGRLKKELEGREEVSEEECSQRIKEITEAMSSYAKKQGMLHQGVKYLEKKAEVLTAEEDGLKEQLLQAEEDLAFAKRLRGDSGTGLQRYVLGIMFSSVVAAANQMLAHVHAGRYRLFRSDENSGGSRKKGLELKVYDKESEESEGRFVNTLSGGEKFLVSLALSIGMSTVAQKSGIHMEALFIDEGFGSLDEDSIKDAMEVLNSIQEANGMVGIISHVQLLEEQIPAKLRVDKYGNSSRIVTTLG